jgi:hypothetical protein
MTKKYKVHFLSDVHESIEIEADSKLDAQKKFDLGEVDFSEAKEEAKENLKVEVIEEV